MKSDIRQWKEQFESERVRLADALGKATEGGIIEAIEHIGATSVPGMHGSSCVDIGLAVWPFPLETGPKSRLAGLGYQPVSGYEESPEQRFLHASGGFQLYFVQSGASKWYDMVLIRDYLRNNDAAREEVSLQKKQNTALDKAELFAQTLPAAHQWWIEHYGFAPVEAVTKELKDVSFPWYISSGWALDLFLGRVTRLHHDVDVVIPYLTQLELQKHLTERGWKLLAPYNGRLELWPPHMQLQLPRHQVHAYRDSDFIDFLLADMDSVWRYRREPLVLRSIERMSLKSSNGIPYLAPELALLFKSKNTSNQERPQDQLDFEKVLSYLEPERRAWLHWALVATSPDHPWIQQLI
ncbi:MAG TPA: GrpB family protein [Anaerolineales bacterium]|nr:GrpB family protein [Anaerolineales bacterium]